MTGDWLHDLPKVELHLHLEGSMSPHTVRDRATRHDADWTGVWDGDIPDAFSFEDFPDFGRQYLFGLSLLKDADDIAAITEDLARTLAAQNVRYAELTTTAYSHFLHGTSHADYCAGLNEGRRRAAALGVEIGWIVDIPRDLEMPHQTDTIDYLEGQHTPDGLIGIGLGGYEVGFPAAPYTEHFARGCALGLASLPHAGETEGADSVRSALDDLHAVRLGHGVRAVEDPTLLQRIVDEGVFLEICPTSNLLLGVVSDFSDHPAHALIAAGVTMSLNTDDPGWFDTDLMTELRIGTDAFGFAHADHLEMQRNALAASFAPDAVKVRVGAELDAIEIG